VATQLTRKNWRTAFSVESPVINVPKRAMIAGLGVCIVVVYAALFASMYTAKRDLRASEALYLDSTRLLAVPPVPLATLEAELASARASLSWVEASANHSTIDPSSDDATALLVQRAQDGGLTVTGVSRLDPGQEERGGQTYDVNALRMNVAGPSQAAIINFLQALDATDPGLLPVLSALSVEQGGARAEIVFSVYSKVEPTPVAGTPEPAR
jgi:hypothetical protein